ncbi:MULTISPECIES: SDR family NAD(P)-dependent oxidoreductase [unclassified Sphingomonas]|uniref:SDR family NAD(P)-dependent oxidoreductase n=1 Tax=unclassified Sphingomonas TaxID=196159 RepID=UPI0006F93E84|nr:MULTISPECIES: SDR family NAD(P)-dependent oxidoreductase [unclassified Sphingomonas]KQX19619.1 3-oxoacyl-ACP reductase [Sphingomonas sp. Root1294]KQY65820.1 3-oxoacyl-ACP reductase [Sphingomonas sp. Root50]KRB94873.1 3-oxoacyl-ACP reductase [Sphingomonas sp. Root720]
MGKLDGKSAIVTGGGRGIGRAVALLLAREGARVVVNDLDQEPADQVVEEIRKNGGEAVACAGSVTSEGFADRFVQTAVETYGGIDIIINNAGYTWDAVIQKMTDEQWHAIVDLHLKAPFDILRAAQPIISAAAKKEKAEGRIVHRKVVNISSVAGVFGNAGQANYASAKAGIVGLTKALAKEWGRYNVNVNCVAFGFILTRLTEATADQASTIDVEGREIKVGVNPQVLEMAKAMIPLGRPGTPEEAAGSVVMLTYPEADYVSGQLIVTGGGLEG